MLIIKNANALMPDGTFRANTDIAVEGGKIVAPQRYDGCEVFDAQGRFVTPGFIDAHCHLGILEEGIGFEGDDVNECSRTVTPELRAIDGINPYERAFSDACSAGITTVVTGPGSANVISGQFCALKTCPGGIDAKLLKEPVALKGAFGENPKRVHKDKGLMTRMETAAQLRGAFFGARDYIKKRAAGNADYNMANEILASVLEGRLQMKLHCHRADDICTAMRIAAEFGVSYTLDHCTEGYMILPELKAAGARCILGPLIICRSKIETDNATIKSAALFEQAGMEVAFSTDHPETPTTMLAAGAALCVENGMSEAAALRALTVNGAAFNGLADRIGTLKEGMDADIAVFSRHPLQPFVKPDVVFINGKMQSIKEA